MSIECLEVANLVWTGVYWLFSMERLVSAFGTSWFNL